MEACPKLLPLKRIKKRIISRQNYHSRTTSVLQVRDSNSLEFFFTTVLLDMLMSHSCPIEYPCHGEAAPQKPIANGVHRIFQLLVIK